MRKERRRLAAVTLPAEVHVSPALVLRLRIMVDGFVRMEGVEVNY